MFRAIREHLRLSWPDHHIREYNWPGPVNNVLPGFTVAVIHPKVAAEEWFYASIGAWQVHTPEDEHIEFLIHSPFEDPIHIETLAMIAKLHADPEYGLKLGQILNVGRPWMNQSSCDHFLISLPYLMGSQFERSQADDSEVRFLWLLPLTRSEAGFARMHSVEALERKLEEGKVDILDPKRDSVA